MNKADHAFTLLQRLQQVYPEARCGLDYQSPWQLLVATILSAQCTDKRVNLVTGELFRQLPDPQALASASQAQVEELIRTTGFFRNKAKNLIRCAQQLFERHQGQVPDRLDDLVALAGVGRKTANVVLGNAYAIPGMVVDTHVKRLANRFGWTCSQDPVKIEQQLCKLLKPEVWTQAGHLLIAHGRSSCKAPIPHCSSCPLIDLCPRIGVDRSH